MVAVDDNNFTVERGTRLGIIGPNGAGKTTTFNMIAGFFKPTSGSIEFEGQAHQRPVAAPHFPGRASGAPSRTCAPSAS